MPPAKPSQNSDKWWSILLRHFTTFVVIVGGLWWLVTPRIEDYILATVSNRIAILERRLNSIELRLDELQKDLDRHNRKIGR